MLIEFTEVCHWDGGQSCLVSSDMIVGIAKAWDYDHDYSVEGVPDGNGGLKFPCKQATRIDVIGGGGYEVFESPSEVREKWEKALNEQRQPQKKGKPNGKPESM